MTVQTPRVPYWQFALGRAGEVVTGMDDLAQCLRTIITTPLGSVALRPEFGCDILPILSKPWPVVVAALGRAVSGAIARWEPRVEVVSVQVLRGEVPTGATLRLTWRPVGGSDRALDIPLGPSGQIQQSSLGKPGGVVQLAQDGLVPADLVPPITSDPGMTPVSVDYGEIL